MLALNVNCEKQISLRYADLSCYIHLTTAEQWVLYTLYDTPTHIREQPDLMKPLISLFLL